MLCVCVCLCVHMWGIHNHIMTRYERKAALCVHVCLYACVCVCIYVYMRLYAQSRNDQVGEERGFMCAWCVYTLVCVCVCACVCVCVCVCVHAFICAIA